MYACLSRVYEYDKKVKVKTAHIRLANCGVVTLLLLLWGGAEQRERWRSGGLPVRE